MRGRILFVAGLGIGYIVGARAGRPAYDAVIDRVQGIADNRTVQHAGEKAKQLLEDNAPHVADVAEKTASTIAGAASAAKSAGDKAEDAGPTTEGSAS